MKHFENIVIGKPLVKWWELCCKQNPTIGEVAEEEQKTLFTEERNLAKILKEIEAVNSIGEVRRNKPDLCRDFTEPDCFWLKWGKKRFWVVVGE